MPSPSTRYPTQYFDPPEGLASLGSRSVRGGMFTGAGQGIRFLLQIGSRLILARILAPEEFGLVAMVTAVTGILTVVNDLGLTTATIQRQRVEHREVSTLFWVNFMVSLSLVLLMILGAPLLAAFYQRPEVTGIGLAIGISWLPLGIGAQHRAILSRQLRFRQIAVVDAAAMATAVTASLLTALWGWGYWALVTHHVMLGLATGTGLFLASGWIPGPPGNLSAVRSMLAFGGNMTGFNLINSFSRTFDQMMIGRFLGVTPLGFYEQAFKFLLLPLSQINAPIGYVAVPALSRLQTDPDRYRRYYVSIMTLVSLLTVPMIATVSVLAEPLVLTILTPRWLPTAPIFSILGLAALTAPFANSIGWLFTSQGRTGELMRWGIINATVVIASVLLGLRWGVLGVATGLATAQVFFRTVVLFAYVGRTGPVRTSTLWSLLPLPFSIAGVASLAAWSLLQISASWPPAAVLVTGIVCTLAIETTMLAVLPAGRRAAGTARDTFNALRRRSS